MNTEEIAKVEANFNVDAALAHLGAYLAGGDELGEVSREDAGDAYNSLYVHVARMRVAINAASDFFDTREDLTRDNEMLAAAGACSEYSSTKPVIGENHLLQERAE